MSGSTTVAGHVIRATDVIDTALGSSQASGIPLQKFEPANRTVGSGSGDDYPALNAAMQAGERVTLPKAIRLSAGVFVPYGAGILGRNTSVTPTSSMGSVVTVNSGESEVSGLSFPAPGGLASSAVEVAKTVMIDNGRVLISDVAVWGYTNGILISSGDVIRIVRPWTAGCGTGIKSTNGFLNSSIWDCYLEGGNGIDIQTPTIQESEGLDIIGGKILPAVDGAFGIRTSCGLEMHITNVVVDQIRNGGNGIIVSAETYNNRAVKIIGCWTGKWINATTTGAQILVKLAQQVSIVSHTFDSYDTFGLDVDGENGICLHLHVQGCRFTPSASVAGTSDVRLRATRAILSGNNFNNTSSSVTNISGDGSYGVFSVISGNDCIGAASPQRGNVSGSLVYGNIGNATDSLDWATQSIGYNDRAGTLRGTNLDVNAPSVVRSTLQVTSTTNLSDKLTIAANGFDVTGASSIRSELDVSGQFNALGGAAVTGLTATDQLVVGATDHVETAWSSSTPSVTTTGGSGLVAACAMRTKRIGKTVFVEATISVTTVGSGSGAVVTSVPYTAAANAHFSGIDSGLTGKGITGQLNASGSSVAIRFYDATYPVTSTSNVFTLSGTYETT